MGAVIVEQRRRPHRAGDEDGILGQILAGDAVRLADQRAQQAVGKIIEIVQPLTKIGVGLAQHLGAGIGLDALDRRLSGQAGHHDLAHAAQPALIMGEHAEGLEHVAMLAGMGDVAALDEFVDRGAHLADRGFETADLGRRILGDEIGNRHARLVQHGMAKADAVGQRHADAVDGTIEADRGAGRRQRLEAAGRDHLRHQHGGGLEALDLFLGIEPRGAVLDDEHAHDGAAAQDRHAEEGAVDLFARLRTVGEGGMGLRVRQGQRLGLARDQADETLARAHGGEVDGLAVEAFGGVEFERAVLAQDVDGADLSDQIAGDQDDEAIQPLLRADRCRHNLAETAQQNARSSESASRGSQALRPPPQPSMIRCLSRP